MKRSLLTILLCSIVMISFAQSPQAFKFQAIARDNIGSVLTNKNISIKISIIKSLISNDPVYIERHLVSSNELGLINLEVGKGTVISGNFNLLSWGSAPHFVKFQLDPAGGEDYIDMGTTQLLSVPYSLYANKAGNALVSDSSKVSGYAKIAEKANNVKWLSTDNKLSYNEGFVGIGTTNPITNLHVMSNNDNSLLKVESGSLQAGIQVRSSGTYMPFINLGSKDYTSKGASIHFDIINNQLIFKTSSFNDGSRDLVLNENGKLGLGIKTPQYKFDIAGDINFSGELYQNGKKYQSSVWTKTDNDIAFTTGKVGIGTSVPSANLHLKSTQYDNTIFRVESSYGQSGIQLISSNYYNPFISFGVDGEPATKGGIYYDNSLNQITFRSNKTLLSDNELVFSFSGNLGIGTKNPKSKVEVQNGDVYINNSTNGIILKSPNGQCWRVTIDNEGNFVKTAITCP